MCFSLESLLISLIWLVVVVGIIRIVVPWVLNLVGGIPSPVMQIINLVLWAVVLIFALTRFVFPLLSCVGIHI